VENEKETRLAKEEVELSEKSYENGIVANITCEGGGTDKLGQLIFKLR
jgi:hypothetical protein